MTEPISEERRRGIYEWLFPELKGRVLFPTAPCPPWARRYYLDDDNVAHEFAPLYIDGKPNMNFWHYECVPRLEAEGIFLSWNSKSKNWMMHKLDSSEYWYIMDFINPDPYAALVEMLEAK